MMEKLIDLLLKLSDFLIYLARDAWCARVGGAWKRVLGEEGGGRYFKPFLESCHENGYVICHQWEMDFQITANHTTQVYFNDQ